MRTNLTMTAGTLVMTAAALWAQASGDVFFSSATVGVGGAAGATIAGGTVKTFAFLSGEISGTPVKGAPYSAEATTETTQTLADGNRIANTTTAMVYRDSQGRERREQSLPNIGPFAPQDPPIQTIFISDPVAGVNYSLNPSEHVAIKLPRPPAPPNGANASAKGVMIQRMGVATGPGLPPPDLPVPGPGAGPVMIYRSSGTASNPPAVEQLGTQSIQGVQAAGTRTTVVIAAGQIGNDQPIQIVDEVWRSPDLQVIVQSRHSDPRMGTTVYTLNNISRSDPSPVLFQVPSDYTIQDPPAAVQKMDLPPARQ